MSSVGRVGKWFSPVMVLMAMWPLFDVSCPLIELFPPALVRKILDHHVGYVPEESKRFGTAIKELPPVITLYGHTTEESVRKVIREHPYNTVLFKGYLTASLATHTLEQFKGLTAKKNYSLLTGRTRPGEPVGGLFSSPLMTDNPFEDMFKRGGRLFQGTLDGIWNGSMKDTYALFVPVGEGSMNKLVNWTRNNRTVPDTSFFGWFSNKSVTTPLHANWPFNTVSLQLAGKKSWLMVDPLDMKSELLRQGVHRNLYTNRKGGVFYPNLKVTKDLQALFKIAHQEAGDMLYFPPFAAHAVVSDAGLNVMTALRLFKPSVAFKIHPWKTLQAAMSAVVETSVERIRYWIGWRKYLWDFNVAKESTLSMHTAVMMKSHSPFYNDVQLDALLGK